MCDSRSNSSDYWTNKMEDVVPTTREELAYMDEHHPLKEMPVAPAPGSMVIIIWDRISTDTSGTPSGSTGSRWEGPYGPRLNEWRKISGPTRDWTRHILEGLQRWDFDSFDFNKFNMSSLHKFGDYPDAVLDPDYIELLIRARTYAQTKGWM